MVVGSIPRIFLTLNGVFDVSIFPNWNRGLGSYAFFFAEAAGLSLTFGAYPIMLIACRLFPNLADLDGNGDVDQEERLLFDMTRRSSVARK